MSEITFTYGGEEITARIVPNTRNFYSITTGGRCFKHTKNGPRETKQPKDSNGYPKTVIDNRDTAIHRLVALTHIGHPPTPMHEVAHNNGIRHDNRAENLRWATRSDNAHDRVKHGNDPSRCARLKSIKPYVTAGFLPLYDAGARNRRNSNRVAIWLALNALEKAKITATTPACQQPGQ